MRCVLPQLHVWVREGTHLTAAAKYVYGVKLAIWLSEIAEMDWRLSTAADVSPTKTAMMMVEKGIIAKNCTILGRGMISVAREAWLLSL